MIERRRKNRLSVFIHSIVGIYLSIIFGLSSLIRNELFEWRDQLVFQHFNHVDPLWQWLKDLLLLREEREFLFEALLYSHLIDLYRYRHL